MSVKPDISRLEITFRNIFGLLCPVLITMGIAYASSLFYQHYQKTQIELKRSNWEEKAEIALASVRSHHTFADLVTQSGNKLSSEIEQKHSDKLSASQFKTSLQKHFDAVFLTSDSQTWAFEISGKKTLSLTCDGLARSRLRVMQRVIEGFIEFSNNEDISLAQINSTEKFIKGVFGNHSAPLAIGRRREGRVTPIIFEGKPSYLYWRQFRKPGATFAAMITIFPAEIVENRNSSLQYVADNILNETRKHMAVAFIPVNDLKSELSVILPSQINQNKEYKTKLLQAFARFPAEMDITRNKSQILDDHIFLRSYVTTDLPYDAVIFSPLPSSLHFAEPSPVLLMSGILLIWALFFFYFYLIHGRVGLPLSVAFRLQFFLSGIMPILLMLSIGFSLIEASYATALLELRQENSAKLNSINEKSDNLLTFFGQNISTIINRPEIRFLLTSGRREDAQKAFDMARSHMQNLELSVDHMFICYPGRPVEMFINDQRARQNVKINLDLSAPSVYQINNSFSELSYLPEILLDPAQSNFQKILGSFNGYFLEGMFFLSYEKESFLRFGSSSKDYYFTAILSESGKIISYVTFSANSEKLLRSFLARELDLMNVSNANVFMAAEELDNSDFTIFPFKKLHALNSRQGRKALNFLKKCRSSVFEKYITDLEHLYLFFPMNKMQRYAGGCIISLSGINRERDLKHLALIVVGVILTCLMYVIASFATAHMLEPLKKITATLHKISCGHLDTNISFTRNDELGQLATTINRMLDGFKERLRLGKFVSTTLDKSLSQTDSLENIKKARIINGTVLFSDIRNFTTLSETWPPGKIATMLNTHLEIMSEEIQKMGGQVEQFIGDAIVAFFPDKEPEDSLANAVKAAIEMTKAHKLVNKKREKNGDFTYKIGTGLEHGHLIAGSLMTSTRSEYTIIGSAKSEAEKFEALSKLGHHSRIIVSAKFLQKIENQALATFEPLSDTGVFELILPGANE